MFDCTTLPITTIIVSITIMCCCNSGSSSPIYTGPICWKFFSIGLGVSRKTNFDLKKTGQTMQTGQTVKTGYREIPGGAVHFSVHSRITSTRMSPSIIPCRMVYSLITSMVHWYFSYNESPYLFSDKASNNIT